MFSTLDSHRSILKTSYLDCFQLVDMLQGRQCSLRKKSSWLWAGFSFYKNRELRETCKQWRLLQKCCNSSRTRQNFLFKRRENSNTKGFSPPFRFCKRLDFNTTAHCSSPHGGCRVSPFAQMGFSHQIQQRHTWTHWATDRFVIWACECFFMSFLVLWPNNMFSWVIGAFWRDFWV